MVKYYKSKQARSRRHTHLVAKLAMASSVQHPWLLLLLVLLSAVAPATARTPVFDDNYVPTWGADGYHLVNQGSQVRLTMDKRSGAGFCSKSTYGSGFFRMRIKVPGGYTAGVVTAFFVGCRSGLACCSYFSLKSVMCCNCFSCMQLMSVPPQSSDRDEVDFEFLGNVTASPSPSRPTSSSTATVTGSRG